MLPPSDLKWCAFSERSNFPRDILIGKEVSQSFSRNIAIVYPDCLRGNVTKLARSPRVDHEYSCYHKNPYSMALPVFSSFLSVWSCLRDKVADIVALSLRRTSRSPNDSCIDRNPFCFYLINVEMSSATLARHCYFSCHDHSIFVASALQIIS